MQEKQLTSNEALKRWAASSKSTMIPAAVALLLGACSGRLSDPGMPWIVQDAQGNAWVDFDAIERHTWTLTAGDRQVLLIAASIASDQPVVLGKVLRGLDRANLTLVLDAVSAASGFPA